LYDWEGIKRNVHTKERGEEREKSKKGKSAREGPPSLLESRRPSQAGNWVKDAH
jgi:hypothetical protein